MVSLQSWEEVAREVGVADRNFVGAANDGKGNRKGSTKEGAGSFCLLPRESATGDSNVDWQTGKNRGRIERTRSQQRPPTERRRNPLAIVASRENQWRKHGEFNQRRGSRISVFMYLRKTGRKCLK